MPAVRVDAETTVEYTVVGAPGPNPDLVLVHGTGGSAATNWAHLADDLTARGRRVIAPNYSGSGATTDDGGPLNLERLSAQVLAAADDAGAATFDLGGFSLGAAVAAHLAARHPDRVRRLVLIGGWVSSADGRTGLQFDLWQRLAALDAGALAQLFTLTGFSSGFLARRPPKATEKLVADALATLQPGLHRQAELDKHVDIHSAAQAIAAPTLVIGSDDDQMVPVEGARALAALIPGARYEELQSGHLVLFEQPAALTVLINDHLA